VLEKPASLAPAAAAAAPAAPVSRPLCAKSVIKTSPFVLQNRYATNSLLTIRHTLQYSIAVQCGTFLEVSFSLRVRNPPGFPPFRLNWRIFSPAFRFFRFSFPLEVVSKYTYNFVLCQ